MVTSQQLNKFYDQYNEVEVTFTKQVNQVLKLQPKHVFIKCLAETFPCIIYSTSMREAKVIANLRASSFQALRQANNAVALRFCFERSEKSDPLSFFIAAKVSGYTNYNKSSPDLYFLSMEYTHRPPDDLIEMLGELLEANSNARRRKEVRIDINPASMKSMGLESKEAIITIEGQQTRCILRDLSFSGAKVLIYGRVEALVNRPAVLYLSFADQNQPIILAGKVLRVDVVANREDIGTIGILFEEDKVPMNYNMSINSYLRLHRYALPPEQPGRQ